MEVHCVQLVLLSWHYLLLTGSRIATDLDPEWKCSRTTAGTIQYHCTVEWEKTPEIGKSWRVIYFFFPLFYHKVRSLPLQIFICLSTFLVANIRLCVDIKPSLRFDCHFWFCSRCDGKTLWCLCEVCISLFGDCRDDTAQLQGPEVDLYFQGKSGKCSPNSVVNEYAWIL